MHHWNEAQRGFLHYPSKASSEVQTKTAPNYPKIKAPNHQNTMNTRMLVALTKFQSRVAYRVYTGSLTTVLSTHRTADATTEIGSAEQDPAPWQTRHKKLWNTLRSLPQAEVMVEHIINKFPSSSGERTTDVE